MRFHCKDHVEALELATHRIKPVCPSFPNIVVVVDYHSEGGSRVDLGRGLQIAQTKDEGG